MPDAAGTPRWIALDGAANARVVVPGVLLRSDNLQSLSASDVRTLVDRERVEVVVDLRTDVEVRLEGPGPMTDEPSVRIEHRSLYPDSGENTDVELDAGGLWRRWHHDEGVEETPVVAAYLSYLQRRPDSVLGAVRTIARADGAALMHCAAGKDRTGVVVAVALDAAGVERGAIVADYLASRERIEQIMERLLGSPTYRTELEGRHAQDLAPVPGTMERFLEMIDERSGGSAEWLTANGLEQSELEQLRGRIQSARDRDRDGRGAAGSAPADAGVL